MKRKVSQKDRERKPEDMAIDFWAVTAAYPGGPGGPGKPQEKPEEPEDDSYEIPVTVQNVSTHNCAGGTVTLTCTAAAQYKQVPFGEIEADKQYTQKVYMKCLPDTIGWYFYSDDHFHWGPKQEFYQGGATSVTIRLEDPAEPD